MNTILSRYFSLIILALAVVGCGQKSGHDDHEAGHDMNEGGTNQALYDEVMKVHDEVMPKMNTIYDLKGKLSEKIANTPDMPADKKQQIEGVISRLDSASEGMMVWMRHFNPLPDSTGEEQAKEYLENEMEKIKKVREDVRKALTDAEAANNEQ
jgi:hypothetical protein